MSRGVVKRLSDLGKRVMPGFVNIGERPHVRCGLGSPAFDSDGVEIQACTLSMDVLGIEETDLDPLVDGVEGVTAFYLNAGDGQILFI